MDSSASDKAACSFRETCKKSTIPVKFFDAGFQKSTLGRQSTKNCIESFGLLLRNEEG